MFEMVKTPYEIYPVFLIFISDGGRCQAVKMAEEEQIWNGGYREMREWVPVSVSF